MIQHSETQMRSQWTGEEGIPPLEDMNAALERALIAERLAPYKLDGSWDRMTAAEQRRLLIDACSYASLKLASMHSCCGLMNGFIALLHAAGGGLH